MIFKLSNFKFGILICLFLSGHAYAQAEFKHCYNEGNAPKGSVEAKSEISKKLQFIEYAFIPALYRRLCGLDNEDDQKYINDILDYIHCSKDSDRGKEFQKVLTANLNEVEGFENYEDLIAKNPEKYSEICSNSQNITLLPVEN